MQMEKYEIALAILSLILTFAAIIVSIITLSGSFILYVINSRVKLVEKDVSYIKEQVERDGGRYDIHFSKIYEKLDFIANNLTKNYVSQVECKYKRDHVEEDRI